MVFEWDDMTVMAMSEQQHQCVVSVSVKRESEIQRKVGEEHALTLHLAEIAKEEK